MRSVNLAYPLSWGANVEKINPNRPLDRYAQTCFGMNPTISRHGIAQARLALLIWLNEITVVNKLVNLSPKG